MEGLLGAAFLGTVSGVVGTGLGGIMAAVYREPDRRAFATMVGFAGGMMFAITVFDLLPEALAISIPTGLFGAVLGAALMAFTDLLLPSRPGRKAHARFARTGAVVGLGIAAHNFAEGLAVGSGYASAVRLGIQIAIIIGLHDIPEGMALATMLRLGRVSRVTVIVASAVAGLPMAAGAVTGALIGGISETGLAFSLGCAGGAMLFAAARLYPEGVLLDYQARLIAGTITGLAGGAFLTVAL